MITTRTDQLHEDIAVTAWADSVDRALRHAACSPVMDFAIECLQMCTTDYYFANAPREQPYARELLR